MGEWNVPSSCDRDCSCDGYLPFVPMPGNGRSGSFLYLTNLSSRSALVADFLKSYLVSWVSVFYSIYSLRLFNNFLIDKKLMV